MLLGVPEEILNQNDELQSLTNNAKLSLRNFEDFRGWPPGVNALLFGMKLLKSKRSEGIPDSTRSTSLERLEKEIKAARVLITDDEVRAGKAKSSDKSTRILSRAIERVEEELMSNLSSFLKGRGWDTSSLIHD